MRIAVAGTREGPPSHEDAIAFGRLWRRLKGSILLHGCCPALGTPRTDGVPERMRGVDAWAEERALARGIPVEHFPALQLSVGWPGCGPERTKRMVRSSDAVICLPGGVGTQRARDFAILFSKPLYDIFEGEDVGPCRRCGQPGDGYGCGCLHEEDPRDGASAPA